MHPILSEVHMAIRYNKDFNKRLYKTVRNYNRKIERAEGSGIPKNRLPHRLKVSDLKGSYTKRSELNKVLNQMENFNRSSVKAMGYFNEDVRTTKWNYDFVKTNQLPAIQYFENEFKRVEKRVSKLPGERGYLNTISAKIKTLQKDISEMDDNEFRASLSAINEFITRPSSLKDDYRQYLHCVEEVMDTLNMSTEKKNEFFKKFEQLTPTQFLYAYDNNDIIGRIYELYFKRDENGEVVLNTDVDSANELIDVLFEEVDFIIEDAKTNSD